MKFLGVHTFGFIWDRDAAAATRDLAAAGFRQFQYLASAPHLDPWGDVDAQARTVRAAVTEVGGQVLAVDLPSSESNLASPNREIAHASVRAYLKVLDLASELGAPWLTVNSGRKHTLLPPPDDRLLDIYRASLERLVRAAESRGVRILLENIPGSLLGDAPAARAFLDQEDYGAVDILYDVTNAAALGERPAEGIRLLADRICLVHLSDAPAGLWRHDPVGTGAVDFAEIRSALEDIGYEHGVVIEAISRDTLSDLVASRRRLVEGGWQFGPG